MQRDVTRQAGEPHRIAQLHAQAERARKLASQCSSQLIADLFEVHARMCERNAEAQRRPSAGAAAELIKHD